MNSEIRKNDLISVVIPTYNRASFLKRAIESVLNQTYDNVEIIIVDDSSNFETEKLCNNYGDKIRYFRRSSKGGIPSACNFGIKNMHGDWFKMLSDDNILHPDCLEVLNYSAEITGVPILISDFDLIGLDENYCGTLTYRYPSGYYEFATELWNGMIVNFETSLIHRSCFEVVGQFDIDYGHAHDYEWCLRACLVYDYTFFHVGVPLIDFRMHKEQATVLYAPNTPYLVNQMREKVRRLIIEKAPQKWNLLEPYLKDFEKKHSEKRQGYSIRSAVKRFMPNRLLGCYRKMRSYHRRVWNKIILSRHEVTCKYCEFFGRDVQLYYSPNTDYIICLRCGIRIYKNRIIIS